MPKISIALYGRNDNYGGNFLDLLKLSIKSLQRSLEGIDYEIVLLDYNPPKDKPLLSECLSEFFNIKHVVFFHKDHLEYIKTHYKNGSQLKRSLLETKEKNISIEECLKVNFIGTFAANMAIKYSTGDYILSTNTDTFFSIGFKNFINKLEPNILYRTFLYRPVKGKEYFNEEISSNIDDYISGDILNFIENNEYTEIFDKKRTIWSAAGNFILMDRNSWKEVGGYLPTIHPRLPFGDTQLIFHAISQNKKIKSANIPIFSTRSSAHLNSIYKKYSNCIYSIKKNKLRYNHKIELGKDTGTSGKKEWCIFRKWAKRNILELDKEYFLENNYKKRHERIKEIFKIILPSKFLLY